MRDLLRSLAAEPRASSPPERGRADWVLFGVLVAIALLEAILRVELSWSSPPVWLGFALICTLLWRRSQPLLMVALAFGATATMELTGLVTGRDLPDPYSAAFLLVLPYSLFRWGAGWEALVGLAVMLTAAMLGFVSDEVRASEAVGGTAILLAPMAMGAAARYRERARSRELGQVKLKERERLARELHDTVAHHVSAIAVRAQAGLATLNANPEAAADALRVIEGEASRTLDEMRSMVRLLREDESPELAPPPGLSDRGVADLAQLAGAASEGPSIGVELSGELDSLAPSISSTLYRLAQESITNARRHARGATRVAVRVEADETSVSLRVSDDGELVDGRSPGSGGYGLLGMSERAELLGGSLHAGPGEERGWVVTAVLPRDGPHA